MIDTFYQLYNFTTAMGKGTIKLVKIGEYMCAGHGYDEIDTGYLTDTLQPLPITPALLVQAGAKEVNHKAEPLHIKKTFEININRRSHYIVGYIYDGMSIWRFRDFTIHHFHQLQNIFTLIEPRQRLELFK